MSTERSSTDRITSTSSSASSSVDAEDDRLSIWCKIPSMVTSRMGAQRRRNATRTSRRWLIAERRGEDVGGRGKEKTTRAGCSGGNKGDRPSWRSLYSPLRRAICEGSDEEESAS